MTSLTLQDRLRKQARRLSVKALPGYPGPALVGQTADKLDELSRRLQSPPAKARATTAAVLPTRKARPSRVPAVTVIEPVETVPVMVGSEEARRAREEHQDQLEGKRIREEVEGRKAEREQQGRETFARGGLTRREKNAIHRMHSLTQLMKGDWQPRTVDAVDHSVGPILKAMQQAANKAAKAELAPRIAAAQAEIDAARAEGDKARVEARKGTSRRWWR